MRGERKVLRVWPFFKGRDKIQKIINLQRFRELVSFLDGNILSLKSGVFNLAPPTVPPCPDCKFEMELLPGNISSGIGSQKDSSHYLRCLGPKEHLFSLRILPAFGGRKLPN